jgi:glycosyltransferase involved in cell wall biosynthesis
VVGTEYGPEFWQRPLRYPIGQWMFRGLDRLIVDSAHKRDVYRRWLLGSKPAIDVVPNGIHVPQSARSPAEMRAALGLPLDPGIRVVAQISRVVPYKGHRVLLHAAARVLEQRSDVVFLVCGFAHPASYGAELVALAERLGIAARVRFVGWQGDIADVWRAVDVHVHASEFDSSPIALHESMALGLPAVTTDAGGIPELVEHERTGLVVAAGDAPALASALSRVLADRSLAERLGRAARERFLERHSASVMVGELTTLFEQLAATRRGRTEEVAHAGA